MELKEVQLIIILKKIFTKLTSNPLFWTASAITATVSFIGFVLSGPSSVFLLGAAVVGINITLALIRYWKEIFYESSLLYISLRNLLKPVKYPWWSEIDEKLILGAIPIKEKGHLQKIPAIAGAILTLLEPFELEDRWPFTTAILPADWEKLKIASLTIEAVDIEGVKLEEIKRAVDFIRSQIEQDKGVYIHCKAGIGRSATVVACYLLKYGLCSGKKFQSPDEAISYIFQKRSQVHLDDPHRRKVIEEFFHTLYHRSP